MKNIANTITLSLGAILAALVLISCARSAWAQSTSTAPYRTWISPNGNDNNTATNCQASAPCMTFAFALPQTAEGGEINCLGGGEPGGNNSLLNTSGGANSQNGVVITGTVTIDCHGTAGGHLVSQLNGFNISAPGSVVTLRGLNINGFAGNVFGAPGINGVVIQAASSSKTA
jgi:hypothetical protein